MVTKYGMSDRIGPIDLTQKDRTQINTLGEQIDDVVGVEVKTLIDDAYKRAQEIILEHMDKLHAVAGVLLEKEKITAEEFEQIFNK